MVLRAKIYQQPFFLFDCQTTGTKADQAYLIEAGWGCYQADQHPEEWAMSSFRVRLPAGVKIPKKIERLTGIKTLDESESISFQEVAARFFKDWQRFGSPPLLIHFAQFERPFLKKMAEEFACLAELEAATIICTHRLSKVCFPNLRSYSLRAVAGHASYSVQEMKRSRHHLEATAHIWRQIAKALASESDNQKSLLQWLSGLRPPSRPRQGFASNVMTEDRLKIPQLPGVYRMLDHAGNILYVGKAKNLKARVNSYFRGRTSKGSRLNELLTRVCDIRYQSYASEFEALLRESDAIKQWDPPYNRQLKARHRELAILDRSLIIDRGAHRGWVPADFCLKLGPLPKSWSMECHNLLACFVGQEDYGDQLWGRELPTGMLHAALEQLLVRSKLNSREKSIDTFFRLLWQLGAEHISWRQVMQKQRYEAMQADTEVQVEPLEDEQDLDDESLELKQVWKLDELIPACARLLSSFAYQCYRSKWRLRLLSCAAAWTDKKELSASLAIQFENGDFSFFESDELWDELPAVLVSNAQQDYQSRQQLIDISVYDRLDLLYRHLRQLAVRGEKIRVKLSSGLALNEVDCLRFMV